MKSFLSVLFLFTVCTVFGQLQKGKMLISGAVDISDSKTMSATAFGYESKTTQISADLKIGFFLSDKSVLGFAPGYGYNKQTTYQNANALIQSSYTKKNIGSLGLFHRYYLPVGDKVSFFIHNQVGLGFGKNTNSYLVLDGGMGQVITVSQKADLTSITASVNPGIVFFVTPRLSIEANVLALRYQYDKQKVAGKSDNGHDFSFKYSMIGLGISWFIGK